MGEEEEEKEEVNSLYMIIYNESRIIFIFRLKNFFDVHKAHCMGKSVMKRREHNVRQKNSLTRIRLL